MTPTAILHGKGHYTRITWDSAQVQAAFLSDRDDVPGKPPKANAYLWERSSAEPVQVVTVATPGFQSGYGQSPAEAVVAEDWVNARKRTANRRFALPLESSAGKHGLACL